MAQENYVEGCSMKRPPLLEPNGFCFWKARFETYVKSKDIDLWQVIQNGDFYFEVEDEETKLMKETAYELLKDTKKKQLGKNEETKMTIYNALPRKEYERVFMCKTAKEFSISNEETINSGFTRFNAIVTSLKSLDLDYSSKNHVRKFLRALPLKWRAKVTAIEEAKYLATLPLDELIGNLKVYEIVLDNNGVASKITTKEKVKSLALKAKVTREQTSDDSDSQGESDEDIAEEEAEAFNFLARNFHKFFRKALETKVVKAQSQREHATIAEYKVTLLVSVEGRRRTRLLLEEHEAIVKMENEKLLKFNKDFSKTFEKLLKEKQAIENENLKLSSKINDLEIEVKKLAINKEVVEPCKNCDVLTKEVDSLKNNVSKLQDEALNFSKFKSSSIALNDMLSRQKSSQDKEGLGFSKIDKNTSASPNKPIMFVKQCQKKIASTSFVKTVIVDSGCTKHMTENRRLFTLYKAYDGGHVVFGSNLKGKVVGGGNITHGSITITNVEHVSGLAFNLISVVFDKEIMRIKESLNITFDESLPEPKSSSSVEDDRIDEPIVPDLNGSPSL
ncbi:hypothetical protein Tco_0067372 [Tanacetum coccineum]